MDNTTDRPSTRGGVGGRGGGGDQASGRWYYSSLTECLNALGALAYKPANSQHIYCNGTWDKVLCWPATRANVTAIQPCPPLRGVDQTKYGYKKCDEYGQWEGKADSPLDSGWTDYTQCYTPEARKIYEKLFAQSSSKIMKEIAIGTKTMEVVGLFSSFLLLSISIFIFCYFRNLKCHRTRIHRNLFVAILIHVTILLVVDIDQFIARRSGANVAGVVVSNIGTIYNTWMLCELLYALMEYTKTVMFMWMLIEGMYLHNMLVLSVFSGKPNYSLYYSLGWAFPVLLTSAWGVTNGVLNKEQCWFGYTFRPYYWILEAPRAAVIAINLTFLVNIIRVLVTKLRDNNSTEAVQVRKAVKAAIVLLPLLGVNNFLAMVEPPMDNVIHFGIWSYTSQFLISFQGVYISLLYCFLNGEVQTTLRTQWQRYKESSQQTNAAPSQKNRLSRSYTTYTTVGENHTHAGKSHSVDMSSMKSMSVDITVNVNGRKSSNGSSSCRKLSAGSCALRSSTGDSLGHRKSSSLSSRKFPRSECTSSNLLLRNNDITVL